MAFISVICPKCGVQSQIDASGSFICPYCGADMRYGSGDVQYAQAPQPVSLEKPSPGQFVPPPDPTAFADPAAGQFVNPDQMFTAAPQPMQPAAMIDPQTLAEAKSKRKRWVYLTLLIGFIQAIPVFLYALGYEHYTIFHRISYYIDDDALILLWMLLMLIGTGVATGLRPDNAYIEKKPFPKNRFALFILLGIILGIGTMVWGAFAGTIIGEIISSLGLY